MNLCHHFEYLMSFQDLYDWLIKLKIALAIWAWNQKCCRYHGDNDTKGKNWYFNPAMLYIYQVSTRQTHSRQKVTKIVRPGPVARSDVHQEIAGSILQSGNSFSWRFRSANHDVGSFKVDTRDSNYANFIYMYLSIMPVPNILFND